MDRPCKTKTGYNTNICMTNGCYGIICEQQGRDVDIDLVAASAKAKMNDNAEAVVLTWWRPIKKERNKIRKWNYPLEDN